MIRINVRFSIKLIDIYRTCVLQDNKMSSLSRNIFIENLRLFCCLNLKLITSLVGIGCQRLGLTYHWLRLAVT